MSDERLGEVTRQRDVLVRLVHEEWGHVLEKDGFEETALVNLNDGYSDADAAAMRALDAEFGFGEQRR